MKKLVYTKRFIACKYYLVFKSRNENVINLFCLEDSSHREDYSENKHRLILSVNNDMLERGTEYVKLNKRTDP